MGVRSGNNGNGYVFETYAQVSARVHAFAAGLSRLVGEGSKNVGLFSVNRPEWLIAEQACFSEGYVTVPLYDTLGDEAIEYIVGQTAMEVAVVSVGKIGVLLKLKSRMPTLRVLVIMDETIGEAEQDQAKAAGVELVRMRDVEDKDQSGSTGRPAGPEDLATICYTSGTTGQPKGVMLKHKTILAVSSAALALVGFNPKCPNDNPLCELVSPGEVYLSYLPLAHVMERAIVTTLTMIGFRIGFYQGDVNQLMGDAEALAPTFFVSVPRLFNRVYDKVMTRVRTKGGISKWLFEYALESKMKALHRDGSLSDWLWDSLVFGSVRSKLGGRVKAMLTGSAPLSAQVVDFMRCVFSCPVLEGYGMTETVAITTLTHPGDLTSGTIGIPAPCVEIKLVDVPELGYTSADKPNPRGEIWVRGTSTFSGYYQDPENTAEALRDGWVVTGDIGMWDAQGRLYLIDRKKSLFKLAQGEYVAPEKIETILARSPRIAQAYVEGNSLEAHLVAIIVPDKEVVLPWARAELPGLEAAEWPAICSDDRVRAAILQDIQKLGSSGTKELKGFEVPRAIHLEPELFSIENGLVTPTFKLKRPVAKQHYKATVERLYNSK